MENEKPSEDKENLEERIGLIGKPFQNVWAHVVRFEPAGENEIRLVTSTVYGEYPVTIKRSVARRIRVGDLLEASLVLAPSSVTDFAGKKTDPDDAVTMSYELKYLRVPCEDYVYRKKSGG